VPDDARKALDSGAMSTAGTTAGSVAAAHPPEELRAARLLERLPAPIAIFAVALGAILFGVVLAKGLTDPDYFWHLTVGELIATSGQIPQVDPFSFTWGGRPWTTHEWLGELLIYWLVSGVGTVGGLVVFAVAAGAIFAVTSVYLSRRGLGLWPIALPASLGALVLMPYVTLRPQILSWLLLALLLWYLLELRADRPWRLAVLPVLFAVWANLHGLWVIGLGFVGAYALFTLAGRTPMAPRRGLLVIAGLAALAATALTPAGPIGILYPLRYVDAGDWGLANISEWQSPDFHQPAHWALAFLIAALVANGGRAAPGWLTVLSWVTLLMALGALRNAPIAAIVAVPVLAMGLDARLADWWRAHGPSRSVRLALRRRLLEMVAAVVVIVGSLVVLLPRDASSLVDETIARRYPVAAVDLLERVDPDVSVLAEYGWGGYVIHELYRSGGRVFVDGRNDMYDEAILEDYSLIRDAKPGWEGLVERYGVEAILFPPERPIVRGFAQDAGWCEAYADERQVLLLRSGSPGCAS